MKKTVDFLKYEEGIYTKEMAEADFGPVTHYNVWDDRVTIDKDHNLCFYMPHMGDDFRGLFTTGGQILCDLAPKEEYTLTYRIKFDGNGQGYDFSEGGKIPGLGGGVLYTGGNVATAGDGFSVRLVFKKPEEGKTAPRLILYVYHYDMPGQYGDGLAPQYFEGITANEWHTIRLYVKMNHGKEKDGVIEVDIDGEPKVRLNDVRFRIDDCLIDKLHLTSFHGGATKEFDTSHDQFVRISGLTLE